MEASKITITNRTKIGHRGRDILQYLHEKSLENDRFLRDTTVVVVANSYALSRNTSVRTVVQAISALKRQNVLLIDYTQKGKNARANIHINYLHPAITDEMRQTAPEHEKEFFKRVSNRLAKAKEENEDAYLDGQTQTVVTPAQTVSDESQLPDNQEHATQESSIAVPVTVKKEGKSISLAITINLNI